MYLKPSSGPRPGCGALPLILLVEDDFVLRSSLSELLTAEGFRVDCCADGREAFRRLHVPPKPNLILLDIMLPHLDGFELRALQRKSPLIANIPVVVISAHDLDRQNVDELGLPPPFASRSTLDRLLSTLRELSGPRPRSARRVTRARSSVEVDPQRHALGVARRSARRGRAGGRRPRCRPRPSSGRRAPALVDVGQRVGGRTGCLTMRRSPGSSETRGKPASQRRGAYAGRAARDDVDLDDLVARRARPCSRPRPRRPRTRPRPRRSPCSGTSCTTGRSRSRTAARRRSSGRCARASRSRRTAAGRRPTGRW